MFPSYGTCFGPGSAFLVQWQRGTQCGYPSIEVQSEQFQVWCFWLFVCLVRRRKQDIRLLIVSGGTRGPPARDGNGFILSQWRVLEICFVGSPYFCAPLSWVLVARNYLSLAQPWAYSLLQDIYIRRRPSSQSRQADTDLRVSPLILFLSKTLTEYVYKPAKKVNL